MKDWRPWLRWTWPIVCVGGCLLLWSFGVDPLAGTAGTVLAASVPRAFPSGCGGWLPNGDRRRSSFPVSSASSFPAVCTAVGR